MTQKTLQLQGNSVFLSLEAKQETKQKQTDNKRKAYQKQSQHKTEKQIHKTWKQKTKAT